MNSIKEFSPPNNKNHTNSSNISSKQKWNSSSSSSHRTPSFSSSSSSFSSNSSYSFKSEEFSLPNSPSTSFNHNSSSGIPFSWETIPGIPKKQILKKIDSCKKPNTIKYLPLPPPISTTKKQYISNRVDPFYTALVECSKGDNEDDEDKEVFGIGNLAKSLSTRFGFVNMSCKNSSNVVESLVFLPRGGPRRISYDVLKKRSV